MSDYTSIAWTDSTANFWMGCTKVSAGCTHCYAETLTTGRMGLHVWGKDAERKPVQSVWGNIAKWNAEARAAGFPRKVFVMSLGDFFEDRSELDLIRKSAWFTMQRAEHCIFQVLTKRPENIARMLPGDWGQGYRNVWLGATIENNAVAKRADFLRAVPAVVRFVSYEPAIGPVDQLNLSGIHWLICGGESGPGYRQWDLAWVRSIRDRCKKEGVAFFFKQSPAPRTGQGETLDGQTIREYPQVQATMEPSLF